ncbi:MAG: hypothetical protein RL660_1370 [Bacteroidota bacterium]
MRLLIQTILACLLISPHCSAQTLLFANDIKGSSTSVTLGTACDLWGNTYATGWYNGTVDFDPGAATYNLTTIGSRDIFVVKYDSSGALKWAKSYGSNCTTCSDEGVGVAVSSTGKVYVTGLFLTTCDFDLSSSAGTLTSAGDFDIFILQLDTAGAFGWVGQMGGSSNDVPMDIALDAQDNIYLAGQLSHTVDIDPSSTVQTLVASSFDGFVAKILPSGQLDWGHLIGSTGMEQSRAITVYNDKVYVCGSYNLTVDFDPGSGVQNRTSSGSLDFYILCLDNTGVYKWVYTNGSASLDLIEDIARDNSGNVFATGYFQNTIDFDAGTGVQNKTAVGVTDAYILKLDSTGIFNWVKTLGLANNTFAGFRIAADHAGNVLTCGQFEYTMDFDPGAGVANASTNGFFDIYMLKLNSAGNFVSNTTYGGSDDDKLWAINFTHNNRMIIGGSYDGTCDFDPGTSVVNLVSSGTDAFVCKYAPNCAIDTSATNLSACDFVTFNNIDYAQSGTYYVQLTGSDGCDSVVKLNVQINPVTATISLTNNTFTASPSTASYQWLNCETNSIVPGMSSQTFSPSSGGTYAAIVSQGACIDTSNCLSFSPAAVSQLEPSDLVIVSIVENAINFYNTSLIAKTFIIYDSHGAIVTKGTIQALEKNSVDTQLFPTGIYFVRTNNSVTKFVKCGK